MQVRYVIFSDIDATLLDHDTYAFKAHELVKKLKKDGHFLILNSSKTAGEIKKIMKMIGYTQPFICENGGGVYVPADIPLQDRKFILHNKQWKVMHIGIPYPEMIHKFNELKQKVSFRLRGFSEMSLKEIKTHTLLDMASVRMAKKRDYTEPFIVLDKSINPFKELKRKTRELGLNLVRGGRFFHLLGNHNKGSSARIVARIINKNVKEEIRTIAIGDSQNDEPMLKAVDIPILMPKKDYSYSDLVKVKNLIHASTPGSSGFARIINNIIYK